MQTIRVETARPYSVQVGAGLLPKLGEMLAALPGTRYRTAALVSDATVFDLYGDTVRTSLEAAGLAVVVYRFPPGEGSKCLRTVEGMLEQFARHRLTRSDVVVALGGGVTGDMAGFAAAVYQRGIDYVQLPTTLLAAIDSSVGGKTAVNLAAGKNLAGAFWQPRLVLCDTDTFATLSPDIFSDGLAEAIKHGCIRDPELFALLEHADPYAHVDEIIARSVRLKAGVVAQDEQEHGLRQILNFGHTPGHGIEKLSGFQLAHGKAVAVGICLMADACVANGLLAAGEARRIRRTVQRCGLPDRCAYSIADICRESLGDKKRSGNTLNLVVLERIGKAAVLPVAADQLAAFFTE